MAKRFTDTELWKEDWFLDLDTNEKLFWFYLKDSCNHAGIWRPNQKYFEFILGSNIDLDEFILRSNHGKERIIVLHDGRWFLKGFIKFQYGKGLNEKNRVHKSIIEALEVAGINPFSFELILTPNRPQNEVKEGVKDKDKDKDIRKDREYERKGTIKILPIKSNIESPLDLNGHTWDDEVDEFLRDRYGRHTGAALYQMLAHARNQGPGWPSDISDRNIKSLDLWLSTKAQEGKSFVQNHFSEFFAMAKETPDDVFEESCRGSLTYGRIVIQKEKINEQTGHQLSDSFKRQHGLR